MPYGITFTYQTLSIKSGEFAAAAKSLERLIKAGTIKRVKTGIFYKPEQTVFGELKPGESEIIKNYLFDKGKRIAYITGLSLYNQLGLTTQVPKNIKIASREKRIFIAVGNIKGDAVKSYIDVNDENYYLLGLLDALKDFKKIPDLDKKSGLTILAESIKKLSPKQTSLMINYALKYPPRSRALLGSILEKIETKISLRELKNSLNPFSEYSYNVSEEDLSTAKNWNIK